jgi:hypothetical protein
MRLEGTEVTGDGENGTALYWDEANLGNKEQLQENKSVHFGDLKITIKISVAGVKQLKVYELREEVMTRDICLYINICLEFKIMKLKSLWKQHRTFGPESKIHRVVLCWVKPKKIKKKKKTLGVVAHACNPSYSTGRDQKDYSLRPAQAKISWDPISTNGQTWCHFCHPSYREK